MRTIWWDNRWRSNGIYSVLYLGYLVVDAPLSQEQEQEQERIVVVVYLST